MPSGIPPLLATSPLRVLSLVARSVIAATLLPPTLLAAQRAPASAGVYDPKQCPSCAAWNAPHAPVRIIGNTYYVGTDGLSALLLTSSEGHVLIDAGLPESAAPILASIRTLGFRVEDVKLIVNSHAHYDHAGGVADLQRATGARVVASASSATVLRTGKAGRDDPQFGVALPFPAVARVDELADGDTLRVGPLAIVAHLTPGHTPGGTSWSWRACEGTRCVNVVYADSQTPISDDTFRYTASTTYPTAVQDFRRGHALLERLPCDLLITPHPGASDLWARIAARESGGSPALIDGGACKRLAQRSRDALEKRLATERAPAK